MKCCIILLLFFYYLLFYYHILYYVLVCKIHIYMLKMILSNLLKNWSFNMCAFSGFQSSIIAALMILQKPYVCEKYGFQVIDENALGQICTSKTIRYKFHVLHVIRQPSRVQFHHVINGGCGHFF